MSKITYRKARELLSQSCERYLLHNEAQLKALVKKSYIKPDESFFDRAFGTTIYPTSGFYGWIVCEYAYMFDHIIDLDTTYTYRLGGYARYEQRYLPCASKITFFPDNEQYYNPEDFNSKNYIAPSFVLDRLTVLSGLMYHIMANENKEPGFKSKLEDYKSINENNYLCLESDPPSVQIYKTLMNLKALVSFVNTMPKYHPKGVTFLLKHFDEFLPTFGGYIKGIAVQELQTILDDRTLGDENAVKALASQLRNPVILKILETNRQSQTEHILKVASVVLMAVGIGVIPTLFLAAKRLYDTGGTSINFFKPLSKNLCEDIDNVIPSINQSM